MLGRLHWGIYWSGQMSRRTKAHEKSHLSLSAFSFWISIVLKRFLPKGFLGELQSGAGRANWPCPGGKNAPCVILSKIILKEFIIQLKFWWKLSVQASQVLERLEEGKGEEGLKEDEVRLKPIIVHILLFSSVSSWLDISKIPNYAKM